MIGRNGIYIEPDLAYIDTYVKEGEIRNCAGEGKCGYTSRGELGYAYAQLLLHHKHDGHTYNLVGESITQAQLAEHINQVFNCDLRYNAVGVEAYKQERKAALGDFIGTVIAGIYNGIAMGMNDVPSDFDKAAGRPHKSIVQIIKEYKAMDMPQ